MDILVLLLNAIVGALMSAYVLRNTHWLGPRYFRLGVLAGTLLFIWMWFVVFGMALGVFIWRQCKGND